MLCLGFRVSGLQRALLSVSGARYSVFRARVTQDLGLASLAFGANTAFRALFNACHWAAPAHPAMDDVSPYLVSSL